MDNARGEINLAYHCVLFVDVLGQREALRALKQLPQTPEEREEVIHIIRETAGFLQGMRTSLQTFLDSYQGESDLAQTLPDENRQSLRKLTTSRVEYRYFSDSVLMSASLQDDGTDGCNPMNGVMTMLLAACFIHLAALSVSKSLRGGIDVGLAVPLHDREIYGPAIERAVYLESKVAGYPRIVVGQELIGYLEAVGEMNPSGTYGRIARDTAAQAKRLIFEDHDGQPTVDFLGEEFCKCATGGIELEMIKRCYVFVKEQAAQFRKSGNHKLALRYGMLWSYLRSRAANWNIELPST